MYSYSAPAYFLHPKPKVMMISIQVFDLDVAIGAILKREMLPSYVAAKMHLFVVKINIKKRITWQEKALAFQVTTNPNL